MATNKNATIRYQALNRCFRNPGRQYYINDLIEACNDSLLDIDPSSSGIKRRQVFDDIKFLRDSQGFDAPIESYKDGQRVYYRYSDMAFSINNQPLNEKEAQQLKQTLMTLSRFKGMPQFDWVEEIRARLEQTFNLTTEDNIISFDENEYLKGREFIGDLFNAIANKQVLTIKYLPFKVDNALDFVIHPYHIKQYNNRWFLFGLNPASKTLSNIALDRIESITPSNQIYKENSNIDFSEYFEDIIGVTKIPDITPIKIKIRIDASFWPYLKTKPMHGSQKTKEVDEDYTIIEIEVAPNYELEALLFSYMDSIEILEPVTLRVKFKTVSENIYLKYK